MSRRAALVVTLALGLLLTPLATAAQQGGKVYRIGVLSTGPPPSEAERQRSPFLVKLRKLGWVEGQNVIIESRFAEGKLERLPELAAELVRLKVDLIVTHTTPGTQAAKQATTTIPIVMAVVGDPVASGLVASLARPGGNITGSSIFFPELNAKRLELLKEAVPRIRRVGVFLNPDNPANGPLLKAMEPVARALKLELQQVEVRGPDEFDRAFSAMAKRQADALVAVEDPIFFDHATQIANLAATKRLPSIGFIEFADAGGLMAYGVNIPEMWRRAAVFVDKILKGAKPADLPVEQPTRFEFVINLKTAKLLGLTIPQSVLIRADQVIR